MNFEDIEEANGVRFAWNVFPWTKAEAAKIVVPTGALYTPLRQVPNLQVAAYDPVLCQNAQCRAILNPYCTVDASGWTCALCLSRSPLPPHYQGITEEHLPLELTPALQTMEYITGKPVTHPPVFLYVVDLCQDEENLEALKETLVTLLSYLPPNAMVGLVLFGTMVQVYDLGSDANKLYIFRGDKEYTEKDVADMLNRPLAMQPGLQVGNSLLRFFVAVEEVEYRLAELLQALQPDPWPVKNGHRPLRCTGLAVNVASALLGATYAKCGARLLLFCAGLGTLSPGLIVGQELKEPIRLHLDIDKDNARHYKKAVKFYEAVAERAFKNCHAIDLFGGCLDQVGFLEMKLMCLRTGGVLLLLDAFTTLIFKQLFIKFFDKDSEDFLLMGFNGTLDVKTLRELKVLGLIGHAALLGIKGANVLENEVGIGGTSQFRVCALAPQHTYAVFFDVAATQPTSQPGRAYIQFCTHYQHLLGTHRVRVTTMCVGMTGDDNALALLFDQEAAAVLMARVTLFKLEQDDGADVLRWIDRMLIKLCQKFADYRKDTVELFRLHDAFQYYPQFIYYLRRSQFLQVFNNSPDETAFYRHVLMSEDLANSLVMIQPTLMAFGLDLEEPVPVLLDLVLVSDERILLLDTFFHILIFHGRTVAQWRKAGYHLQDDYADFAQLLAEPRHEAGLLLVDRFPLPRFIDTEEGGSQARFLYSKLNPSTAYNSQDIQSGAVVLTDDVSLQVFMSHLQKLVVLGSN